MMDPVQGPSTCLACSETTGFNQHPQNKINSNAKVCLYAWKFARVNTFLWDEVSGLLGQRRHNFYFDGVQLLFMGVYTLSIRVLLPQILTQPNLWKEDWACGLNAELYAWGPWLSANLRKITTCFLSSPARLSSRSFAQETVMAPPLRTISYPCIGLLSYGKFIPSCRQWQILRL